MDSTEPVDAPGYLPPPSSPMLSDFEISHLHLEAQEPNTQTLKLRKAPRAVDEPMDLDPHDEVERPRVEAELRGREADPLVRPRAPARDVVAEFHDSAAVVDVDPDLRRELEEGENVTLRVVCGVRNGDTFERACLSLFAW
ncbi:MAG: hypothetical protein Q9173_000334 [Seirophora scorigena]